MNIFDCHLHIIDPRFPLYENNGFIPDEFSVEQYIKRVAQLNIQSGAVVSGSFQQFDQSYLTSALDALGDSFVGVTQLPVNVPDEEILRLNERGVRAVRFNVRRGGSESIIELSYFADRVYELVNWHVELYADHRALEVLKPKLCQLSAVCIDHLGLDKSGIPLLKEFVAQGVKVKASGFGRIDFDALDLVSELYRINPEALMFGTDLPSTRAPLAFEDQHLFDLMARLGKKAAEQICWSNARKFYGFIV
ncbi:MAG: putative TIM-barrel fold metal-dependent hydrolase [Oleiphilaceae bacterium]